MVNIWMFHNEPCCEDSEVEIELNMNACEKTEFNCGNGHCIPIIRRCNGKVDCDDRTGNNLSFYLLI